MVKTPSEKNKKVITRNKGEKLRLIKEATKKLIIKQGYLATTNHGIAKTANVSVGLLYKYFPKGKPDILHQMMEDEAEEFEENYQELLDISRITVKNWVSILKNLLALFVKQHFDKQEYIRAMEIAMLSSPDIFIHTRGVAQELMQIRPFIDQLYHLGIISKRLSEEEIILNTILLDQMTHQYVFFHNIPVKTKEEFLDYLFHLAIQIFKIEIIQ